jgi:hypothetical protein
MAFKLRTIEHTAAGREIVRDRQLAGSEIAIGRAAESDVHLTDLAVESHHARMALREGGRVEVKSSGTRTFTVDGTDTTQATIDSQAGAELGFGSCRITVSQENGEVLRDLERKRGFSLVGVLPGKRIMSWGLAAAILAAFLLVPIVSAMLHDPDNKRSTVIGDSTWSTGELSLAHHHLEDKCETCHVDAFVSVRDETCLSCHEQVHDHADPARLAAARGNQPLGTQFLWSVAHTFGKKGPGACADCHIEHEGKVALDAPSPNSCAECHFDLKKNLPGTRLGNASDFGTLHPQFTPAVVTDPVTRKATSMSLDTHPREDSGLTFPHKLHLGRLGGAARMAANIGKERGYGRTGLQCKDCHRPSEDGIRFKPINMERDCESCHSLSYDQVGGIFRKLHHGDVDQLIADLRAADLTRPPLTSRRRPGDFDQGKPYHFEFSAPVWKGIQITAALSKSGVCGECHRPMLQKSGKPGVVPVTLVSRYMNQGWFDHKAHKQEKCASCHAAETSATSADVLLPGIKDCRTCHLGENSSKPGVPSSCSMCHGYHMPERGSQERKPDTMSGYP